MSLEAVEASEVAKAEKAYKAVEVSKTWKTPLIFQVVEINNLKTSITLFWRYLHVI